MDIIEILNNIKSINAIDSQFIKSASNITQAVSANQCEIAMLGRSNVGKSSLINTILNHKLAKSSNTPGKTKLINFFKTDIKIESKTADSIIIPLVIIDFPGSGYAKVDKKTRNEWDRNLSQFLAKRSSIKVFCHLIDSRHLNLKIDSDIRLFLESIAAKRGDCKIMEIYTKCDKLNKNQLVTLKNKILISNTKKDVTMINNLYVQIIKEALDLKM